MKKVTKSKVIPLILIFICLGITIYFTSVIVKYPLIGMEVREENEQWIVEKVYENGWASNLAIEKGAIVALVDKKNVDDYPTVKLFHRIEMAKSITFIDEDARIEHYSISYHDMDGKLVFNLLLPLLFSVITLALSTFLYLKTKRDQAAIILIYFLLSLGVCYLGAFVSARGDFVARVLILITLSSSIVFLFHFLREYFLRYDITFIKTKSLYALYLVNVLILIMNFGNQMRLGSFDTPKYELMFFLLLLLTLLFHLLNFYRKQRYSKSSPVIKILGLTVLVAFGPFVFFYIIPNVFLGKEFIPTEVAAIFLIIIPISLVYLLLAEKLFDIEFMLNRLRYYSLLAFPFSILIVLLISFVPQIQLDATQTILVFITLLTCLTLLLYIKEYLDYKLRYHLFSRKDHLEMSLYTFFQKAKREAKVSSLVNYLQNEIKEVLGVHDVFYSEVYRENEGDRWSIKAEESYPTGHLQKIEKINWDHSSIGNLIEVSDGYGIVIGGDQHQKKAIHFGMKNSKTNLNIQEKVWLETLAYFSSILLENLQLIEELIDKIEDYKEGSDYPPWLSRLLFSLAEKERTNLSIDLHDSVLQDQLQLLREIEQIQANVTSTDLRNDLSTLQERMLDNIHLVRETCNELQPPFLSEIGVIQSIQNLINQTNLRCSFILTYELDKSIQWLDKDVELTLYRVVQELLNNAMEHSEAKNVCLSIEKKAEMITLTYQDDGVGFDLSVLQDSFKTMGLFGLRERVKSIGGSVQLISAEGVGMSVAIEFKEGGR